MLNFIVAVAQNGVIGSDGKIPWEIPGELKYFKQVTTPHAIVMGRKTYESIGRALPDRPNYVLTRDAFYEAPGCFVITDIQTVLALAEEHEVFVIGGAEVFELFFPYVDKIYQTIVHRDYEGDTYFPKLDAEEWELVASHDGPSDVVPHTFEVYKRK